MVQTFSISSRLKPVTCKITSGAGSCGQGESLPTLRENRAVKHTTYFSCYLALKAILNFEYLATTNFGMPKFWANYLIYNITPAKNAQKFLVSLSVKLWLNFGHKTRRGPSHHRKREERSDEGKLVRLYSNQIQKKQKFTCWWTYIHSPTLPKAIKSIYTREESCR